MNILTAITELCKALNERNRLMSELDDTLNEITTSLGDVSDKLSKGFEEVTAKIDELAATVANGETVDPATIDALRAKVDTLAGQAQALDDVVPDVTSQDETSPPS